MTLFRKSIPLIIAALLALGSAGAYLYLYGMIESINGETATLTEQFSQSSTKQEQLRSVKALLADTATARAQVDLYFIGQDGVVDFLKTIEGLGKISRVALEVDSVNVEGAAKGSVLEGVPIGVRFSGSFSNSMRFLYLLERFPVLGGIRFARLTHIDNTSSIPWSGTVTAHFSKLK